MFKRYIWLLFGLTLLGVPMRAACEEGSGLPTPAQILFQSDRDGDWELYVLSLPDGQVTQLTHNSAADEYPAWSPDGRQIAFKSNRDGNYEIYVMNADGSDPRNLTNHPALDEDPAWSPDGARLAFHSDRTGGLEIFLMQADGAGLTQFTDSMGRNALADWSPDGTRIAYTGNRYLGWNVYVATLDRTVDTRLTDGHGACRQDWSPDGRQLAYVSGQDSNKANIWVMNADGSGKRNVTNDPANYNYYPDWSSDGQYLVYAKSPDKERGNWELYVIAADGSNEVRLTNHPANDKFPAWFGGPVSLEMLQQIAARQTTVYEAEHSPRLIGKPVDDPAAANGQAVHAQKAEGKGFLAYGPYVEYPAGTYTISFYLRVAPTSSRKPLARLDVTTDQGQSVLAQKDVSAKEFAPQENYHTITLAITLTDSRSLEFRVYTFGVADLWLDLIAVQAAAEAVH